jgi:branched-chain amino acid aminotransferase
LVLDGRTIVFLNGQYVPLSEAKISVLDHGFLYGDGVFEGIRAYDGVIFQLREHVDRLYNSARYIRLEIPYTRAQMMENIVEVVRRNRFRDAYIRVVVSRGEGDLGLDPRSCRAPSTVIVAEPAPPIHQQEGPPKVRAIFSSYRRDAVDATTHEAKTLNYLNSILAKMEAVSLGHDDAIMLDHRGFVSEASATNVFMVRDAVVYTPPPTAGILHGITRRFVIHLCRENGIHVLERDITPFELVSADEVFLTGTKAGILALVELAGRKVGDGDVGPLTSKIYGLLVRAFRDPRYGVPVYPEEREAVPAYGL